MLTNGENKAGAIPSQVVLLPHAQRLRKYPLASKSVIALIVVVPVKEPALQFHFSNLI